MSSVTRRVVPGDLKNIEFNHASHDTVDQGVEEVHAAWRVHVILTATAAVTVTTMTLKHTRIKVCFVCLLFFSSSETSAESIFISHPLSLISFVPSVFYLCSYEWKNFYYYFPPAD